MKIDKKKTTLQTNADGDSIDFGIGDVSTIIDILRRRLYSHPLRTMIQEYLSNARDANREAKNSLPIEITCPTKLDPVFKVRDLGPGLSPERVREVFVFYGSSTKRADDTQTGGFGIGAKSAWAYTDSFTIVSIFEGKKSTYVAHLGKNTQGSLDLIDEESTEELSGVEISVSIQEKDVDAAVDAIFRTTLFWESRPVLKGILDVEIPSYYRLRPSFKGQGYYLDEKKLPFLFNARAEAQKTRAMLSEAKKSLTFNVFAVIDGIPYEVTRLVSEETRELFQPALQLYLMFNTGEIQVNANREEIVFDEASSLAIGVKIKEVIEDLSSFRNKSLGTCTTLPELEQLTSLSTLGFTALLADFETTILIQETAVSVKKKRGEFFFNVPEHKLYELNLQSRIREWKFSELKLILSVPEDLNVVLWEEFLKVSRLSERLPFVETMWAVKGKVAPVYRPYFVTQEQWDIVDSFYKKFLEAKAKKESELEAENQRRMKIRKEREQRAHRWGLEAISESYDTTLKIDLKKIEIIPDKDQWVYEVLEDGVPGSVDGKSVLAKKILYANSKLKLRVLLTDKEREEETKKLGMKTLSSVADVSKFKLSEAEREKIFDYYFGANLPSFIKNFSMEFVESLREHSTELEFEILKEMKVLSLNPVSLNIKSYRFFYEEEIQEIEKEVFKRKLQMDPWLNCYSFFNIIDYDRRFWEREALKLVEVLSSTKTAEEKTELFSGLANLVGLGKKKE